MGTLDVVGTASLTLRVYSELVLATRATDRGHLKKKVRFIVLSYCHHDKNIVVLKNYGQLCDFRSPRPSGSCSGGAQLLSRRRVGHFRTVPP